jgi:NADH-quinone oxidoreductase subunit E
MVTHLALNQGSLGSNPSPAAVSNGARFARASQYAVLRYLAMSPAEQADIKERTAAVLARHPKERSSLIPLLQEVQEAVGYLPREAMEGVAEHLNVSPSAVYGVATFYSTFSLIPRGEHMISVCLGTACHVRGSTRIIDTLERELGIKTGGTTKDRKFSLEAVRCLGCCALAPVMVVDGKVYGKMTGKRAMEILRKIK